MRHPTIILTPSLQKLLAREYFGLVKCQILPPRGLYHPVLPVRAAGKLMFPLCRTCVLDSIARDQVKKKREACLKRFEAWRDKRLEQGLAVDEGPERFDPPGPPERFEGVCTHEGAARAFQGTWCTPEIYRALDHGYTVLDVREVHDFASVKLGLFEDYVNTFLKAKQEASGWPRVK